MDSNETDHEVWLNNNSVKKCKNTTRLDEELQNVILTVHCVVQTTFLETITADIPTILFFNKKDTLIRKDLYKYFDELAEVGVVHYRPESAAEKVNAVSSDPSKWWYSKHVRSARKCFQNNVCFTSPDAIDQWSKYIKSIY